MKRSVKVRLLLVLLIGGAAATLIWWFARPRKAADELTLFGNVDLRQVELAFNNNERIAAVLVQEGDHVRAGQALAPLDTSRIEPQVAHAQAQAAAQPALVPPLHNRQPPQEIAPAPANTSAAK